MAKLVSRSGGVAITAAISPYRAIRNEARTNIGRFVEVFVRCPLDVLVQRDTKGLYAKALRGEIQQFTGVSDPYEEPLAAEVVVDTDVETLGRESTRKIIHKLELLGYLAPSDGQIAPHGGHLVNRVATPAEASALSERLFALPRVSLTPRAVWDLDMIGVGGFSPLTGFLTQADYTSVVERMRLANGLPWSIPITLSATEEEAARLGPGTEVALVDASGDIRGVLSLEEVFRRDVDREAELVYRMPRTNPRSMSRRKTSSSDSTPRISPLASTSATSGPGSSLAASSSVADSVIGIDHGRPLARRMRSTTDV